MTGDPIHSVSLGEGAPVVFIHGLAASHRDWESLLPVVAALGCRAWALDLPGHGASCQPSDPAFYTADNLYSLVAGWLGALPASPPYTLVGHSLGGYLSLRFALQYPERVRALALVDPLYDRRYIPPALRWLESLPHLESLNAYALRSVPLQAIQRLLGLGPFNLDHLPPEQLRRVAADYKRASPHMLRLIASLTNLTPSLARIHAPCLVIWGDKDLSLVPSSFPRLVSALPHALGHVVPGSGHQPHLGRPDLVNPLIAGFIQRQIAEPAVAASPAPGASHDG